MPLPDKGKCNTLNFVGFGLLYFGFIVTNSVYLFKLQWREELFFALSPCWELSGDMRVIKNYILYHNILEPEENLGIKSNLSGLEAQTK